MIAGIVVALIGATAAWWLTHRIAARRSRRHPDRRVTATIRLATGRSPPIDAYGFYERKGFTRPPDQIVHDLGR